MLFNDFISNVAYNTISDFGFIRELTSASATEVYTFDVIKGTVSKRVFDIAFPKTDKEAFQREFIRAWYNREEAKIAATAESFRKRAEEFKSGEGTEEQKTAESKLTTEQLEQLKSALTTVDMNEKEFTSALASVKAVALHTVPFTVRLFVSVVRKENPSDEVKEYFAGVYKWIVEAKKKAAKDVNPYANIKPLKEGLEKLTKNLWIASEGCIEQYVFHANTRLTVEVAETTYKGLGYDNKGNLKRRYASDAEITREVVLQMFKQLLEKEAAKEAEKEAAKDEQLATANNPAK